MVKQNNDKELQELIIARLEVLPGDVRISIGSLGNFSRDELITHVKKDDKVGNVGYEIPVTSFFYKYEEPRKIEEIEKDIKATESEVQKLLKELGV